MNCDCNKGLNAVTPEIESELRLSIQKALKNVTAGNSPYIFSQVQTKDGYLRIENMVLERMIGSQEVAAAIIPQLELEFNED